ncbi:hypothetical protein GQ41_3479 [Arenibacter algicola]|uniref:Carboxypeptidase regulatory-like domain-containing protein n=1 Tax=Arenibacter algicola TaxID=616991 RepID=A0ABY3AIE8_9FLAO|tara:strand:+ start:61 stop:1047 length:987 start_codon:yes stop_codon:yes gene_type:complete
MKTTRAYWEFEFAKIVKWIKAVWILQLLLAAILIFTALSCIKSEVDTNVDLSGKVNGTVKDHLGNPYPNTLVSFTNGSDTIEMVTDTEGSFSGETNGLGKYSASIIPPLSTEPVTALPISVPLLYHRVATVDFVVKPKPVIAHLNFGSVQLLEEIVNKDGSTPTDPNEPLFAANIFDDPIGLLTPIIAPDGHQITLSEFQTAKGKMLVHCNGDSSNLEISLEGMIPNGTYTFWLAYLNKTRSVGEQIDFMNDFVNFNNPPIGPDTGTENIAVADGNGVLKVTLEHGSCILTDEAALVIPVLYHINGKTFGGGHVPDPEEMVHMLVYFQ